MECYNIKSNEELKFISKSNNFDIRISHIIIKDITPSELITINPYIEFKVKNDLHGEIANKKLYLAIVYENNKNDDFVKIDLKCKLYFEKNISNNLNQGDHTIEIKIGDELKNLDYLVYVEKTFNINEY
jgi:hypothetical protein